MIIRRINKATANALLFLIFLSLRLLSVGSLSILFLPFLLVSEYTFFLTNIALIPLALFLLLLSSIIKLYQIIRNKTSKFSS